MRNSPVLLAVAAAAILLASVGAQEVLDGAIAAVVNNDVVTFSEVRELVGAAEKEARGAAQGQALVEKIKELRRVATNDLIDRKLILQNARSEGRTIPDPVVDDHIEKIIRDSFGGDRAAFLHDLAVRGFNLKLFREHERDSMTVEQMQREVVKDATPGTEQKVREEWLRGLRQKAYIKVY